MTQKPTDAEADLFKDYELLLGSVLFDPRYYQQKYADVAASNMDPLIHYIEIGARELRDPSAQFDAQRYAENYENLFGERPENPLLHYLKYGVISGLGVDGTTSALGASGQSENVTKRHHEAIKTTPQATADKYLSIDLPRIVNGVADAPIVGSLTIVGWAVAKREVESVDVFIDEKLAASARHGLRRPDVAAALQGWKHAVTSGFFVNIPSKAFSLGEHTVRVVLKDRAGTTTSSQFRMEYRESAELVSPLRIQNKIPFAEVDLKLRLIAARRRAPHFQLVLRCGPLTARALGEIKVTLASLGGQHYPEWQALITVPGKAGLASTPLRQLLGQLETLSGRYDIVSHEGLRAALAYGKPDRSMIRYVTILSPGDLLGSNALMELALAAHGGADFIYCDESVCDAGDRRRAWFKPDWSPDLLLSTNYIGRAWCARADLIERALVQPATFLQGGGYDAVLRLTEAAKSIVHVAQILIETRSSNRDSGRVMLKALRQAIRRQGIEAQVVAATGENAYRVQRALAAMPKVSIIILSCGARGLVRKCIETLRNVTAYPSYEIICVENCPVESPWRAWIHAAADCAVSVDSDFNWSTFSNIGAARASGDFFLFLHDDTELFQPGWLNALLEHAQRPEVGVVGPQLLYPDRTVQSAGLFLADAGQARRAFRHLKHDDAGYFSLAQMQRNVTAVTGACLLTRRDTFESLGGFDDVHAAASGDLDFCLKARQRGLLNIFTPYSTLIHHERASGGEVSQEASHAQLLKRWEKAFLLGDPYFNRNLSMDQEQFVPEIEPTHTVTAQHPLFPRSGIKRILVVKLDHIGDCVIACRALRELKRQFPAAEITVLGMPSSQPIWDREPAVSRFLGFSFFREKSGDGRTKTSQLALQELQRQLRVLHFDLAVDLRKQPDTRHFLQLTGATYLAGFDYQAQFSWLDIALEWEGDIALRNKRSPAGDDLVLLVHAIAQKAADNAAAGLRAGKAAVTVSKAGAMAVPGRTPLVCVHPAAGSAMRQWSMVKFARLIDLLMVQGVSVALVGSAYEAQLAEQILAQVERPHDVISQVGKLSLAELPGFLVKCDLFVGNNSGPHHLAAELGIPTIGIHSGVVSEEEWAPVGRNAVAIRRKMSCSPCYIEYAKDCPRQLACLSGLGVGDVYRTCLELLSLEQRAVLPAMFYPQLAPTSRGP